MKGLERDAGEHLTADGEAPAACSQSGDHKEGVAAFLERRAAKFTGR